MKIRILVSILATCAFPSAVAYAGCAEDIPIVESRMTSSNQAEGDNQSLETLKTAYSLLEQAESECGSGDEAGATATIEQLRTLLSSVDR